MDWFGERPADWFTFLDRGECSFFPLIRTRTGEIVPHPLDLAVSVTCAAVGRRQLGHIVDLVTIVERVLPLGAIIWAGAGSMRGFTPEGMVSWIRRNSIYPRIDWNEFVRTPPIEPLAFYPKLRAALDEAEAFVLKMPTDKVGLLFLKDGKVVQPDPDKLDEYQTHAGQRRGHWPSNSEIESAMLAQYNLKP